METSSIDTPNLTSPDRMTGAIRGLKKGFGFIAGDDGRDYFFHWSAMEPSTKNFRELILQERVAFTPTLISSKWRAVEVRVL
jgi:cold shock CspA family protein